MSRDVTSPHDVKPLSARSAVLSLLLGSHPARMSPRELTRAGAHLGIPAPTLRVALSRALAAGELRREGDDYTLGPELLARQQHQDEGVADAERPWDGAWEMAVVIVTGRPGPERAALRALLAELRLAELREGVWTRPANLRRRASYGADPTVAVFTARPYEDPASLASRLWDLDGWATRGHELLTTLADTTEPPVRLAVAAAVVRHLASDPLLPAALLPADWPGPELRTTYAAYRAELRDLAFNS